MPPIYAHDPFVPIQHALAAQWLDLPMVALTDACQGWTLAALAILWSVAVERRWGRALPLAAALLVVLATDGAAVLALKHAFHLPRPLAVLGPREVRVLAEPLRRLSFPSGHSSAAAALAAYGLRARGARKAWPLAVLAALGGVSRVYVGAHWAVDVFAGWAVGVAMAMALFAAIARVAQGMAQGTSSRAASPANAPPATTSSG